MPERDPLLADNDDLLVQVDVDPAQPSRLTRQREASPDCADNLDGLPFKRTGQHRMGREEPSTSDSY